MTIRQAKRPKKPARLTRSSAVELTNEFIDLSADNLDIAATTPNSFIYTGLGDDAINVSQVGGNNVLDATGVSNFWLAAVVMIRLPERLQSCCVDLVYSG